MVRLRLRLRVISAWLSALNSSREAILSRFNSPLIEGIIQDNSR